MLMKSPFPLYALAAGAVCALLTASALAQAPAPVAPTTPGTIPPAPAATPAPKPLSPVEKNFIRNAGKSINYLVKLAMAGKNPAVTDDKLVRFRDKITSDLNKAWAGLNKVAGARGETIATELAGADKIGVEKLGKLKEERFLKEWLGELAKEAKKLDKDFESAGRTLQDPELKTFAANYTPIVNTVYTSAESQEKELKKK